MARRNKALSITLLAAIVAVLLFSPSLTFAQAIPPYINYQGRLTNQANGAPVNGVKTITFSLYSGDKDKTPIYQQNQQVNITNGTFSVCIGKGEGNYQENKVSDGIPAEVFTEQSARYLGIRIADSPTEMTPRQLINSVAYAYKAGQAEQADRARVAENLMGQVNVNSTGNVGIGTTSPAEKLEVDGNIKAAGTVKATSFEGDGSKLRGVRQHSLDAADGDPVDAVYVDNEGMVGIGTTNPKSLLRLDGPGGSILGISLGNGNGGTENDVSASRYIGLTRAGDDTNLTQHSGFSGIEFGGPASADSGYLAFHTHYLGVISDERMRIDKYGNVGIGTRSPSYKLHVAGDAMANHWYTSSDSRLKENITPLTNAIDKVSALRGIYFNLKGESPSKREVGVIAQEVEAVLPEVVSEDTEGYKSVDYSKLTPLLIEAVKAQQAQIELLKTQLKTQDEAKQVQIEALKTQTEALQARIEALESK